MCTPIESPTKYAIKSSQRFAPSPSLSYSSSHFNAAQNTMAVKNDDTPYTSPSTAENQNESENVYARAPTNPANPSLKTIDHLIPLSLEFFYQTQ